MDQYIAELIARVKSAFALIHCARDLGHFVQAHHLSRKRSGHEDTEELYSGMFQGVQINVECTTSELEFITATAIRCHIITLQLQGPGERFPLAEAVLRFDEA